MADQPGREKIHVRPRCRVPAPPGLGKCQQVEGHDGPHSWYDPEQWRERAHFPEAVEHPDHITAICGGCRAEWPCDGAGEWASGRKPTPRWNRWLYSRDFFWGFTVGMSVTTVAALYAASVVLR